MSFIQIFAKNNHQGDTRLKSTPGKDVIVITGTTTISTQIALALLTVFFYYHNQKNNKFIAFLQLEPGTF